MTWKACAGALLVLVSGAAKASDLSDAFSAGQSLGSAGVSSTQGAITAGQGTSVVPNYTGAAPETSYFAGGQGALFAPATGKISNCATGPQAATPYAQQDCDAVNFLAKNPSIRPQVTIGKNDPLVTGAKSILANPQALAGSMDGSYSACSTATVNQPATYDIEVCNQYTNMTQSTCQKILTVTASMQHDCVNGQTYEWWGTWSSGGSWNAAGVQFICDSNHANNLIFHWLYLSAGSLARPATRNDLAVNPGTYYLNASSCSGYYVGGGQAPTASFYNGQCSFVGWTSPYGFGAYIAYSLSSCNTNTCIVTSSLGGGGAITSNGSSSFVIAANQGTQTMTKSWDNQCSTLEALAQ